MKKILLIVIIALVVLVIGWVLLDSDNPESENQVTQNTNTVANTNDAMEKEDDDSAAIGEEDNARYVEYSPDAFAQAANKRRVLFFYANWCPICRPADADFQQNMSSIPDDAVVLRVNYNDTATDDAERELAQTYGVTYQHTFVQIDASGAEVTKWNGGDTTELLANIQ